LPIHHMWDSICSVRYLNKYCHQHRRLGETFWIQIGQSVVCWGILTITPLSI
jgi:hypothetical protein